jgi:FixJ family two-component response regulator
MDGSAADRNPIRPSDATVLLVDDADVREGLARLLRSSGWKTRAFATANDFLEGQPYDHDGCIVLDVFMPGMSGTVRGGRLHPRPTYRFN